MSASKSYRARATCGSFLAISLPCYLWIAFYTLWKSQQLSLVAACERGGLFVISMILYHIRLCVQRLQDGQTKNQLLVVSTLVIFIALLINYVLFYEFKLLSMQKYPQDTDTGSERPDTLFFIVQSLLITHFRIGDIHQLLVVIFLEIIVCITSLNLDNDIFLTMLSTGTHSLLAYQLILFKLQIHSSKKNGSQKVKEQEQKKNSAYNYIFLESMNGFTKKSILKQKQTALTAMTVPTNDNCDANRQIWVSFNQDCEVRSVELVGQPSVLSNQFVLQALFGGDIVDKIGEFGLKRPLELDSLPIGSMEITFRGKQLPFGLTKFTNSVLFVLSKISTSSIIQIKKPSKYKNSARKDNMNEDSFPNRANTEKIRSPGTKQIQNNMKFQNMTTNFKKYETKDNLSKYRGTNSIINESIGSPPLQSALMALKTGTSTSTETYIFKGSLNSFEIFLKFSVDRRNQKDFHSKKKKSIGLEGLGPHVDLFISVYKPKFMNLSNPENKANDSAKMVSLIAHEIRTPINCVINLIEGSKKSLVKRFGKFEAHTESIKDLGLSINILSILLETCSSILDFLKPGVRSIKWTEFELGSLLSDIKVLFDIPIKEKGLKLYIEIDTKVPQLIKSDPIRLRQVVINLVSNAIKYTKKGYVTIRVSILQGEACKSIRIAVEDTGLGIKEDDLKKLFREFGKIENKQDKLLNSKGVGLGLNLSNDLSKLLGPNPEVGISVKSEYGHGSCFSFDIQDRFESEILRKLFCSQSGNEMPLFKEIEDEIGKSGKSKKGSSSQFQSNNMLRRVIGIFKMRKNFVFWKKVANTCKRHPPILLVDDNEFNLKILRAHFSRIGIPTEDYTSPQEALDCIQSRINGTDCISCKAYKVIITDFEMPYMDGLEFRRSLYSFEEYNDTTIILSSANDDYDESLKVEFDSVITKPITAEDTESLISKYLWKSIETQKCSCKMLNKVSVSQELDSYGNGSTQIPNKEELKKQAISEFQRASKKRSFSNPPEIKRNTLPKNDDSILRENEGMKNNTDLFLNNDRNDNISHRMQFLNSSNPNEEIFGIHPIEEVDEIDSRVLQRPIKKDTKNTDSQF